MCLQRQKPLKYNRCRHCISRHFHLEQQKKHRYCTVQTTVGQTAQRQLTCFARWMFELRVFLRYEPCLSFECTKLSYYYHTQQPGQYFFTYFCHLVSSHCSKNNQLTFLPIFYLYQLIQLTRTLKCLKYSPFSLDVLKLSQ